MIYLRAGVYAEGPSDYDFLCRLLDRYLDVLAAPLFAGNYEVADTVGIDAPNATPGMRRAERIALAVSEYADVCGMFVVHSDGASNPRGARESNIEPGIAAARAARPGEEVIVVGCVPVREIEAWLLTDRDAFRDLFGKAFEADLPTDPEKELDPKSTLRRILKDGGGRIRPEALYALFGERVRFEALRALPAFRVFEADVIEAIKQVARAQGRPI